MGIQGITAVAGRRIVEIDTVKPRTNVIKFRTPDQSVICDLAEIRIFKIIYKHGEPFFDVLPDDMLNDEVRFTGTRRTDDQ